VTTDDVHDRQGRLVRDGSRWDQRTLSSRTALVCGVGNIGDPLALMLARLGFARVDCMDSDVVSTPNLSRGVSATPADVGEPKARVVSARIAELCPQVETSALIGDLRFDWPCTVFGRYDVVLVATHDPASRLHVNRSVHLLGGRTRAIVEGGLSDWSFSVQTIVPGRSPCYECALSPTFVDGGRWQGCGGVVTERETAPAATNGPTGMAVAALMASEAGLVAAELAPMWDQHRFEFDGQTGAGTRLARSFRESCHGHAPAPAAARLEVRAGHDPTVREIRREVAALAGTTADRVTLCPMRLVTRRVVCQRCGAGTSVWRLQSRPIAPRCAACGNADADDFAADPLHELGDFEPDLWEGARPVRLADVGLPPDDVLEAYVGKERRGPLYVLLVAG
jgi:ThiF family